MNLVSKRCETLLAAICWQDTSAAVVIVREPPVAVGEVDRRVLVTDIDAELGLISCVWSRSRLQKLPEPESSHGHSFHGS